MSDGPDRESPSDRHLLIVSARSGLEPLLVGLIDALADDGGTASFFAAGAFVQELLEQLRGTKEEEELLRLMLDISLIGFQNFDLSDSGMRAVDRLQAECKVIASNLTASAGGH